MSDVLRDGRNDPVLGKLESAKRLLAQAAEELGTRPIHPHRKAARIQLGQALNKIESAIECEKEAG